MLRKAISYGGMLLLVGAALFATPGAAWAQRGGHGGGHFGGFHGGGHFGGFHGGAHFGGSHAGAFRGGFHSGYRPYYHHYGFRNYGYSPYYYNYYPYSYDYYPYLWSGSAYDSGYAGSAADVTPYYSEGEAAAAPPAAGYQSFYSPAPAQPDTSAHVTAHVPAGAQLWFEGTLTTSTGPVREFVSPPLTPGGRYTYDVRARWNENGHEVTQTQQVAVTPGAHIDVNFPVPPKPTEQASASR
jgi:uncharacterized protein (TIGR03000 family)